MYQREHTTFFTFGISLDKLTHTKMTAAASSAAVCDSVALSFVLQMEILCGRRTEEKAAIASCAT